MSNMSIFAFPRDSFFHDPLDFESLVCRHINDNVGSLGSLTEESGTNRNVGRIRAPRLDMVEDKNNFIIRADVPGLKKEEISINLKEDVLTIEGTRKSCHDIKTEVSLFSERSYGHFSRALRLPTNADTSQMYATMIEGVLELRIKKRPDTEK
ncbi:hypothetical protein HK096_004037, partial [Nowakowskiella sp. JEL0078]